MKIRLCTLPLPSRQRGTQPMLFNLMDDKTPDEAKSQVDVAHMLNWVVV